MATPSPERLARYYIAVGKAIRSWATFEQTLVLILHWFLNTDQFRARIVWAQMANFRARRNLLDSLAATYLDAEPLRQFQRLSRRAKTLGDKRNMLAHSVGILDVKSGQPFFMRDKQDEHLGFDFLATEQFSLENVESWSTAIDVLTSDFMSSAGTWRLQSSTKKRRQGEEGG
jgi:hypothetical protein